MKQVEYVTFRTGRSIGHAVRFDEPISKEQFEEYVRAQNYWGYHPAGYGGHAGKGAKENEWIWYRAMSCD